MRTNIVLDDTLVEQAFELAGKVKLRPDFDHKSMRKLRDGSD